MNVITCLKQVPDTADVKIDPQTNTLVRKGIQNIINPLDTYALEESVRLKERSGGKVTALSMGPPQAEEMLREAISLGADEAVLLSDPAFAGADTWATARTLAAAMNKLEYDIIICGRQTLDGDTGQVAPELAEMLNLPFLAYVSKIEEISEGKLRVQRLVEEGHEVLEAPLPAVITVVKEINEPRLPSLRGTMKSKSATIPVWTVNDLEISPDTVGLPGSFTQVIKVFFPQRTCQAEIITGDPETQVDCLIGKLKDSGMI
ncbi:electron transfer flavoprotein subunit beta/FixA family protein [Chloroflexota bacterium]